MSYLCIAIRWFDDRYHGKNAYGEPEWPPSPLRLFQALLASAYRQSSEVDFLASFRWLQNQCNPAPVIIAPRAQPGRPFVRFVPNNDSDVKIDRQNRLAAKTVCPTLLLDASPMNYVWRLSEPIAHQTYCLIDKLCKISRSLVTFGWGIDTASGSGTITSMEYIDSLPGERWLPQRENAGVELRVPCSTTLTALTDRYKLFSDRLQRGFLADLPPFEESAFRVVGYRRATDPVPQSFAAFKLLKPDKSDFRAFNTVRHGLTVAGMLRHSTKLAAQFAGWPENAINASILGHGEAKGTPHATVGSQRFAYLPLPSIETRGQDKACAVGSIRRVLLTTFINGYENEIAWSRRAMSGLPLIDEDSQKPVAVLSTIPANDSVVRRYIQASSAWATVTPVVLPGYDDPAHYRRRLEGRVGADEQQALLNKLYSRTDFLLRKAITHAGLSQELGDNAEIEWRKVGFWAGTELADRYGAPRHLKHFPRFHVRIRWRDARNNPLSISGPICLGGGRFYGLGLFAAVE